MTTFSEGLGFLSAGFATGLVVAVAYFILCKLIYAGCVFVALVVRLSQTPAEAQGQPSWMALADAWYEKVPLVMK